MPMHGGQPSCERCIAEVQVAHARERARQLPALEARLADLGGPAPEVLCGYAGWSYGGDPFKFGEEKTAARMAEIRPSVTAAGAARDAPAFVDFLLAQKQVKGKVGTVGYCMGGGLAIRTAAAVPNTVAACASFHGSQLVSAEPDSPHALAPKVKAEMYLGFAIEDRTMPPEAVERLTSALDTAGVKYGSEVYAGARHGWCVKDHTVYNEPQAERAWLHMIALFRETLR